METVVEFKAGLMALTGGRLVPDTRKGLIRVCQDEAGLAHFCWFVRDAAGNPAGEPEKDIVIIPGESTFSKIARPGSRVFELRFRAEAHRNLFFWAQEADAAGDDDYVATINLALNQADAGDSGDEAAAMEADALPPAPAPPAAPAASSSSLAAISGADLAAVLGSILSGGSSGGAAAAAAAQRRALDAGPSLGDVLRPELVAPLLQQPGMAERLALYLPEEQRSAAAIRELVSTPQFRHQLDLFSHALMTGQLDTSQFGLPPGGFGVADFLRSIQAAADEKRRQPEAREGQGGGGDAAQQ